MLITRVRCSRCGGELVRWLRSNGFMTWYGWRCTRCGAEFSYADITRKAEEQRSSVVLMQVPIRSVTDRIRDLVSTGDAVLMWDPVDEQMYVVPVP